MREFRTLRQCIDTHRLPVTCLHPSSRRRLHRAHHVVRRQTHPDSELVPLGGGQHVSRVEGAHWPTHRQLVGNRSRCVGDQLGVAVVLGHPAAVGRVRWGGCRTKVVQLEGCEVAHAAHGCMGGMAGGRGLAKRGGNVLGAPFIALRPQPLPMHCLQTILPRCNATHMQSWSRTSRRPRCTSVWPPCRPCRLRGWQRSTCPRGCRCRHRKPCLRRPRRLHGATGGDGQSGMQHTCKLIPKGAHVVDTESKACNHRFDQELAGTKSPAR